MLEHFQMSTDVQQGYGLSLHCFYSDFRQSNSGMAEIKIGTWYQRTMQTNRNQ